MAPAMEQPDNAISTPVWWILKRTNSHLLRVTSDKSGVSAWGRKIVPYKSDKRKKKKRLFLHLTPFLCLFVTIPSGNCGSTQREHLNKTSYIHVPLVEFMYHVFTSMPGESNRR